MGEAGPRGDGAGAREGGGAAGAPGRPWGLARRGRGREPAGTCSGRSAPLLPGVPLRRPLDPFCHPFLGSPRLSRPSCRPPVLPPLPHPSSALPSRSPRRILPSLRLPPARFSSLQLAPAFSTSIPAPFCQVGGFPQQEMEGTSCEKGGTGKVGGAICWLLTDLVGGGGGELPSNSEDMLWLQFFCVKNGSSAGLAMCEGFLKATSVSAQG